MRIPSVKTIRRILIGVIGVVALTALMNYFVLASRRPRDDENRPAMISAEFRHAAEGVEIFVRKGADLRFTVRARHLKETVQNRNYLEGIEASDFNRDGSVRNSIYSESAVYDGRRMLDFDGDVRVLLGDGGELRAEALHYDLDAETGVIPGKMAFISNNVSGFARDARFFRDEDRLELDGEVDFSLTRDNNVYATAEGSAQAIRASAARGTCLLGENRVLFFSGVRIASPDMGALSADAVDIKLNSDRSKILTMTASGNVAYEMLSDDGTRSVSGERMIFTTGATGVLEKVLILERADLSVKADDMERTLRAGEIEMFLDSASGSISGISGSKGAEFSERSGDRETLATGDAIYAAFAETGGRLRSVRLSDRSRFTLTGTGRTANELRADTIDALFRAESGAPENITANGGVRWLFEPSGATVRTMLASKLEVSYAGNYPASGEASGSVTLEESDAAARMTRRLSAERMLFDFFSGTGQIKSIKAEDEASVFFERAASSFGKPDVESYRTYSDVLEAFFILKNGTGELLRVEQNGNFRFVSDGRRASADIGEYDADKRKLTLTGSPEIYDSAGRVNGDRIEYNLEANELLARGRVLASIGARQGKSSLFQTGGGATPVAVTAEELRYWPAEERFRFSGSVTAMTESQQLSAWEITIDGEGNMTAGGGVLHRIHQSGSGDDAIAAIIESRQMKYRRDEDVISYSDKVEMKSNEMTFSADALYVSLDDEAKDISRILAEGNVLVHHDGRVSSGDAAQWTQASSSYIITGNPAIIDDPARGRSVARRMTYFQDEDRITLEP